MNEMLQDEASLASQTHGCCEGGRRPWKARLRVPEIVDARDVPFPCETDNRAEQVIQERGEVYGPFDVNMYGTALQISGMLAQFYGRTDLPVLPAYMAAMIATAFKSNRIVKSPTHEDSHLDHGNYLKKVKELA